ITLVPLLFAPLKEWRYAWLRMEITAILDEVQNGVPGAADRLALAVFADLHRIAQVAMRRESDGHTLQPTELVDEAFVRLIGQSQVSWQNRAQFFAVASRTIRRILVDHARHNRRQKRDHGVRVTLDESISEAPDRSVDLVALDDALERLEAAAPRQARVVEMRFFGGLEVEETAHALGISPATVKRDWTFARAFLLSSLQASA
ncbi:MAG: sigma-70 family RNA polymerase sigma factor, partial [Gemmatimonadaceae bacterium]